VLAVVDDDNALKVFELPSLRERWGLPDVRLAALSPDGRFIGTVTSKGEVAIRQAGTNSPVGQPAVSEESIAKLAFSRDGELFATGTEGGLVILRQTRTGKEVGRLTHDSGIDDLAFAADGSVLASTSKEITRIMECRSGMEVARSCLLPRPRAYDSVRTPYLVTEADEGLEIFLWRD
jgi:WD40 repeat protein